MGRMKFTFHTDVVCFQIRPHFAAWFKLFQVRIRQTNIALSLSGTLSADDV